MECPDCNREMLLLFQFYVCEFCEDRIEEMDADQKTPTQAEIDEFFLDSVTPTYHGTTLPLVACPSCGASGYAGSMCFSCQKFRP